MRKFRALINKLVPCYIAFLLATGTIGAQQQSAPAPKPASGYRIAGMVVNAATGDPVRRATVAVLSEADSHAIESVETDSEGRFVLDGLAADKYQLTASKRGFITAFYDQHEEFNTAIVTGPGQEASGLIFRLAPGAVLHGLVTGGGGDPVEEAKVMLFVKPHIHNPGARITQVGEAITDDTGAYEFDGLAAGEYLLAVKAEPWYAYHHSAPGPAHQQELEAGAPLDVAYPITFFDSTSDESSSSPIVLTGGSRDEANFNLHTLPALRLTVESPMRQDRTMIQPELRQTVFGTALSETHWGTSSDPQTGAIELSGVAPGHYELTLGDPPRVAELDLTSSQQIDPELGTATVVVSGTVRNASGAALPKILEVHLESLSGAHTPLRARVEGNQGKFSFASVPPGAWALSTAYLDAVNNYKRLPVVSITMGSSIHTGDLLTVQDKPLTLQVTISDGQTRVEGFARKDKKGQPGVMVVLVPREPAAFRALARRDQSDSDGSFALRDVAPGRYTVVAIQDGWELDWEQPNVIGRYLPQGISVTVNGDSGKLLHLPQGVPVQSR